MRSLDNRRVTTLLLKPLSLALLLTGQCASAFADTSDVFNFGIGQNFEYDNNLFRQPQNEREDYVSSTSLTLDANKQIGRQTLSANLNTGIVHFARDQSLDYRSQNYRANWVSGFGVDSHMGLEYTRSRTLQDFADQQLTRRNIVTHDGMALDATLRAATDWQGVGLLAVNRYRNSDATVSQGDNNNRTVEAGLRYAPSSGNYVDLRGRLNKTNYPDRILSSASALIFDNSYKQYDLQLSGVWAPSAISNVDARLTRVRRRHDTLKDRDFDAWTGSVGYTRQPSGASTVSARVFRDVGAISEFSALYATTRGVSLQHTWLPTAKLRLNTFGSLSWRRYVGDSSDPTVVLIVSSNPQEKRRERIKTVSLNLTYVPTPKLQLALGWQTESRRSNLSSIEYRDQIVNLSAQYTF